MKRLTLIAALLMLAGCTTTNLIETINAHGCDISSYKTNTKRGSVEVQCK